MDEQSSAAATKKSGLPKLPASTIWMINFGFGCARLPFTLQSSQMSRIFQTIGRPQQVGLVLYFATTCGFNRSTDYWLLFRSNLGT